MPRTSLTHPLQIDSVTVPQTGGLIGLTICPGLTQGGPSERAWNRDLDQDLAAIKGLGERPPWLLCRPEQSAAVLFTLIGGRVYATVSAFAPSP
jgi:ADP-ribosyl-[dinitrogen reductase] hydrolase